MSGYKCHPIPTRGQGERKRERKRGEKGGRRGWLPSKVVQRQLGQSSYCTRATRGSHPPFLTCLPRSGLGAPPGLRQLLIPLTQAGCGREATWEVRPAGGAASSLRPA